MRIDHVKAGMMLSGDILDEHGNLMLEKGIVLTQTYITRLRHIGIRNVPIADPYADTLKQDTVISSKLREELALSFRSLFFLKSKEHL
ncbi:MAG: phosphohydrolase, partial [Negativicutes bacterium]|nr:phosphohydrolase [Negativicutes bacterium]